MKLRFALLFILIIGFSSAALTNTTVLNETFEGALTNWTTDWALDGTQFVSGANSIMADSVTNDLVSIGVDLSDAVEFYISFRYYIVGVDGNDNVNLYYYDGAAYNLIDEIGDDAEGSWLTFSQTVTDAQYFDNGFNVYIEGSSIDANENLWIDDFIIVKNLNVVNAPNITNISGSHSTIKGGDTITIYANSTSNGVNDSEQGTLYFYCDSGDAPTAANTDCTGGTLVDIAYPYVFTCTFATASTDINNTEYCRVYDGESYSSVVNLSYVTDSSAPSTSVTSVAGDITASYFDTVNDAKSDVIVSGEALMSCRWSSSDLAYSAMSSSCVVGGVSANCSVTDVASQGFHTRYIACQDSLGNEQNASNNLAVSFYLDYTVPTTSDNSNENVQSPPYSVTINEQDNVDSDVTSYYCKDTVNSCTPTTSIDDGGTVTFTVANRGVNYLRYYSVDDAGNSQTVVSKTININRLPILTSATDNASVIQGGASVNVSTVSNDSDSGQQLTLWVCNSSGATFEGCTGVEYCNTTGSANLSCAFNSESDSASHSWYAYLFDASDEGASGNPKSGSYVTDSSEPLITVSSPLNGSTITQSSLTFTIVSNEALASAWYSLNGGVTNISMTNTTLYQYGYVNSSISDGDYNVTFWTNDSYGNLATSVGTSFTIDSTGDDLSAPGITVYSPIADNYYTVADVVLNITTDESLAWAGYTNNSGTLTNLSNVSLTNWNTSVSFGEGQHDIIFYANDSSSNKNQANESLTIYVDLNNPAVVNFSCPDVNDSVDVVCAIEVSDAIGSNYVVVSYNSSGSWVNSSQIDLNGVANYTTFTIGSGNSTPNGFAAWLYVYDLSGRINGSSIDFISIGDDSVPLINNFSYSPNASDDLDPGVRVYVNATVTEDYNISSIALMYYNISASSWSSVTMANNSALTLAGNSSVIYNASFVPENGTWVFRINATDSAGNYNLSVNTTLIIANDVSQNISNTISDVESITYSQRAVNNSLGNLIMNNSGDGSIWFNVSLSSGTIGDRLSVNYTEVLTGNFSVASGDVVNITINVNTTGLISGLYSYNVSIVSDVGTTVYEKQLNVQTAAGAYLVVSIDAYSASVSAGDSGVSLVASVRNLGTADATDVYLNWSLPSGFSLASGSVNRSLGALGIGVSGTNSITVNVASSAANSLVTLNASASSSNAVSASDSKNVTIGSGPSAVVSSPASSGGSGGSGGGGGSVIYSKVIEIVRGEEDSFNIEVYNKYFSSNLEDLTLNLSGFLSQYVEINTPVIYFVGPNSTENFSVSIEVPAYKEDYEEYSLTAVIKGFVVSSNSSRSYKETQNILLIVQEASFEDSNFSLAEAEKAIAQMRDARFSVVEVENILVRARSKLSDRRNKEALLLAEEILKIRDLAFDTDDLIDRVLEALLNPRKMNLISGNVAREIVDDEIDFKSIMTGKSIFSGQSAEEVLNLARVAFSRGDYELANERARSAQILLLLERKGSLGLFLFLYWPIILFGMFVFSVGGIMSYRSYQKSAVSSRVTDINREESNLRNLFSDSQKKYFEGKISSGEYHNIMNQHEKKLANLRKTRLNLRNRRIKILKPRQIISELEIERKQTEDEIRKLQINYYKDRRIGTESYELQFKVLNERLAEIEGERTTFLLMKNRKKSDKVLPVKIDRQVVKARKRFMKEVVVREKVLKVKKFVKKDKGFFSRFSNWVKNLPRLKGIKKDKKGIMLMDSEVMEHIKKGIKGKDVRGKWIKLGVENEE